MKLITLFPAFLLLVACSPKPSSLAAISCVEIYSANTYSNMKGSEIMDDHRDYTETNHYLLNYETGQVKRWIDKEGAPLVSRENVRFKPDFISWNFYTDDISGARNIKANSMVLNRETLEINGKYHTGGSAEGIGGDFQLITMNGQCEKTDIPWKKLKTKKI